MCHEGDTGRRSQTRAGGEKQNPGRRGKDTNVGGASVLLLWRHGQQVNSERVINTYEGVRKSMHCKFLCGKGKKRV